jgi:hypothetical protein
VQRDADAQFFGRLRAGRGKQAYHKNHNYL